jgi:ABC-type antimicrobial peptide transport system ATPase subunit
MPTIPIAPDVTITAQLQSIVGAAAAAGYLRVTLCGYGPVVPLVSATCIVHRRGTGIRVHRARYAGSSFL